MIHNPPKCQLFDGVLNFTLIDKLAYWYSYSVFHINCNPMCDVTLYFKTSLLKKRRGRWEEGRNEREPRCFFPTRRWSRKFLSLGRLADKCNFWLLTPSLRKVLSRVKINYWSTKHRKCSSTIRQAKIARHRSYSFSHADRNALFSITLNPTESLRTSSK